MLLSITELCLYSSWNFINYGWRKIIAFSHLATPSCLHFHNVPVRVEFWHHRWQILDPQEEMFQVAAQADLVAAMLKVSPNLQQVTPTPSCTISRAQLFSTKKKGTEKKKETMYKREKRTETMMKRLEDYVYLVVGLCDMFIKIT